ncbi:MAG: hypothetical protein E6J91_43745 [Deltaproteobacteria bacterium]|nr:MAG: hypothetical protein E6J91_43745 [Deltaproteobacteria bacterium]
MLSYELAINEDGEPFAVPPQVKGWRARRIPSRGRPKLIHDRGKPLIIAVDATHADLLSAAGPGRYRLEAVDEHRRKVEGIPAACTGPLSDDEIDDDTSDDDEGEIMSSGSGSRRMQMEDVVCQLLTNQARMVEATLGQMGTVIAGVAGLLHAVHQTGAFPHVLPQVAVSPPPPPMPPPVEPEPDEAEDDAAAVDVAPPSMLPEALRLIIEKTIDKLVPLIFEKLTSGEGLGSLPLAAFLDWRKAMPNANASVSSAPAAPSAPAGATEPVTAPAAPAAPASSVPHAAPSSAPASAYATHGITAPPPAPATASAGAVPSPASPLGAAPAAMAPAAMAPAGSLTPQELTHEEAAAMLNAHILQIWQGLSPAERGRASELISGLTDSQRSAWFAELARLSVPEAIARARAVLHAQPPPNAPNTSLLTATPKGDPS